LMSCIVKHPSRSYCWLYYKLRKNFRKVYIIPIDDDLYYRHFENQFCSIPCQYKLLGFLFLFLRQGSCYAAQAGLKLKVLLLQPSECWD
jgi:hypothetical protein